MSEYNIQVRITDALVSFTVNADNLDEALVIGRKKLSKMNLFDKSLEIIDSAEEVTGVY